MYGANQAVMAAFARGDHAAIARHYTEDAEAMYDGFPTTVGRENIEALTKIAIEKGIANVKLETDSIKHCCATIVETGIATLTY